MSVVSGVTLICSLMESEDEEGEELRLKLNIVLDKLDRETCEFTELSNHYTGNKHPQHFTYGAGINFLDEDAFAKELMSWEWCMPENVVLVIKPEEGATRVFRPNEYE